MGIEQLRANSFDGTTETLGAYILDIEWSGRASTRGLPPLVGPFESRDEAETWAALNIPNGTWNVAPLARPYEDI